jgi:hypothetical protein
MGFLFYSVTELTCQYVSHPITDQPVFEILSLTRFHSGCYSKGAYAFLAEWNQKSLLRQALATAVLL